MTDALDTGDIREFQIDTYRSGRLCSVRVVHLPTGLVAERHDMQSSLRAREECLSEVREHLAARGDD